jgi:preprotein translocase subunit SecG
MLGLFYQYLIHHHKIVLPGLGTVVLQRKSSASHFADHDFLPPSYTFQWMQTSANPPGNFFIWMAHKLNIAEEEAAIRVTNFISDVKREINAGKEIKWNGVGIIRRGLGSGIELEAERIKLPFEKKVHGEKVVHHDSSHTIIVGDKEKTSVEMTEILNHPVVKNIQRATIALIAAVLLFVFMLAYLWKYGMTTSSVANQKKLTPKEAPATYRQVK